MNTFLKAIAHAAIGGFAVGLTQVVSDPHGAITAGNILLPALASALTSVVSLFSQAPKAQ